MVFIDRFISILSSHLWAPLPSHLCPALLLPLLFDAQNAERRGGVPRVLTLYWSVRRHQARLD